ncbi:c3eb3a84-62c9-4c5b-af84-ae19b046cb71 [Sclerotinia trifoliorum]|uniref:C3eb3a84-62c9-4c5b-af84-ae19b046cb71 n=1 Tax=Sclerotinia trifoliorum TaxID=28548 RepID=A0A8H2VSC5_9HELO|nr:c3eb3a84-62c9-4c5b-af84-ae19b046cb71 [Sclerotinia trifoliorum]
MATTPHSPFSARLETRTTHLQEQLSLGTENNDNDTTDRETSDLACSSSEGPDSDEQHLVCPCGNPGHVDLEKWDELGRNNSRYHSESLTNDTLDMEAISQGINEWKTRTQIRGGFCHNCQRFLEILPDILSKDQSNKKKGGDEDEDEDDFLVRPHFQCTAEFQASYKQGCRLCILLEQCHQECSRRMKTMTIESFYKIETRRKCLGKPTTIYMIVEINHGRTPRLKLNLPGEPHNWGFNILGSLSVISVDVPDPFLLEPTTLAGPEGLELSQFEVARRWITTCFESHSCCTKKSDCHLPTRLLAIKDDSARLVLTANLETKPIYATLSHCWGSLEFLKLTTESLDSMVKMIPTEKLTKTFREAISFVQSIGIDYIWIDSLCIIQDSEADWEIESASMASVYRGSAITIAATGASNGTIGCFLKPQEYIGHIRVEHPFNDCSNGWNIAQPCGLIEELPLGRRAWTLQERLLSPRVLHFAPNEIIWECRYGDAREYSPRIAKRKFAGIYSRWGEIVNKYTGAQLTYSKDKLVAIAGIAFAANEETGDEYLAGLWRTNLEEQLLWIVAGENQKGRPASWEPYRAPSWSWASIDGQIYYGSSRIYTGHTCAHVLSSSLTYAGADPYVQVTKGTMELCCKAMLPGILQKRHDSWLERWQFVTSGGGTLLGILGAHPDSRADDDRNVFILPIFDTGSADPDQELDGRCFRGLILGPSETKKGEFHRVGIWLLEDRRGRVKANGIWKRNGLRTLYDACLENFVDLLQGVGVQTAKSECARILDTPKYAEERYTITIV